MAQNDAGPSVFKDKAWHENVFVGFTKKDGSSVQMAAKLEEIDWSGGEKNVEYNPFLNGGGYRQPMHPEPVEFTGTFVPTGVSAADGEGLAEWFYGSGDLASSKTSVSRYGMHLNVDDFQIAVLMTNDVGSDSTGTHDGTAEGAVGPDADVRALRWVARNAVLTEQPHTFDDGTRKIEMTWMCPPFDETGSRQIWEDEYEGDASESLESVSSALGSYGSP